MRRSGILALAATLALVAMFFGGPAAASTWIKAESERFIVYSDVSAQATERFTRRLESYDRVLRLAMGLPPEVAPQRKLPVYLTQQADGLSVVSPGIRDEVAGFYSASDEDVYAIVEYGHGEYVLFHEYAHHFMHQNFDASFPGWFVEGFAEYYATTEIRQDGSVYVGKINQGRAVWLNNPADWINLSDLFRRRAGTRASVNPTYYPLAWLTAHWFLNDPANRPKLVAYLNGLGRGADGVAAMEQALGMSLPQFQNELEIYLRRNMPFRRVTYDFPAAPVSVTTLPASASELILLNQRLKGENDEEYSADTLTRVRAAAARYPADPFARLVLGHAELKLGEREAGRDRLLALLEEQPQNVEALQYLARSALDAADADPDSGAALIQEARGYLGRAYQADDANYYTFYLLAQSRSGAPGYPNDNDMTTWSLAYALARQLPEVRIGYAHALMVRGRSAEAVTVLRPLANAPHGGGAADVAQRMIDSVVASPEPESEPAHTAEGSPDPA